MFKNSKTLSFTAFLLSILILINNSFAQRPANKALPKKKSSNINEAVNKVSLTKALAPKSFADMVEDILPAVVSISSYQDLGNRNIIEEELGVNSAQNNNNDNKRDDSKRKVSSIGSGFIIADDGYIITNSHVVEQASEINITLHDNSKYKAKIIGVDKKSDLALLKIEANKMLKYVRFGDSNKSRVGDWAIVVGNPFGLGASVSLGIISARGRDIKNGQIDEYIQTDAAINKGNSGGPLFNANGEVIGINSAIFSPSGGNVGIGFATPANNAIVIINQLRNQGEVSRGWIGASIQEVTSELADSLRMERMRGAFVSDVVIAGPADKAGIIPTDVIIRFDENDIDDIKSLTKLVSKATIGKVVKVVVWRQGKIKNLSLTIEKSKDEDKKDLIAKTTESKLLPKKSMILGLNITEYKNNNIEALQINDVTPKSEAYDKGLMMGDIILSVNQNNITSIDDLINLVEDAKAKNRKVFLFIKRADNKFAVVLNSK